METYFKNNFLVLSYDEETRLGKAQWIGRLRGAELREAYLLCLEMMNRFSLTRWLADDRLMGSIDTGDLEWSLEVFVPRVAQSSLLRMARLPSLSEKNLEAINTMVDKGHGYDLMLVFRDFDSEEAAMAWLMEPLR